MRCSFEPEKTMPIRTIVTVPSYKSLTFIANKALTDLNDCCIPFVTVG